MATFNRATYIEESIDSLMEQTVAPDEIIIIDDGSTDNTTEVVSRYGRKVRYVRKVNGGRSSALNLGLSMSKYDWIWIFDDDDVALPESLALRLTALAERPDADVVYSGQIVGWNGPNNRIARGHVVPARHYNDDEILLGVLMEYPFRLQGMLIRKARLDEVGGFDEEYLRSQDYELYSRLFQGSKVVGLREPTFIWRNHFGTRGPASHLHDGSQRDAVWMDYDGRLGRRVRAQFPLGMFLVPPLRTEEPPSSLRRMALLNRLAVMASKGLLIEMQSDLAQSVALGEGSLNAQERQNCVRSMLSPYFLSALLRDPKAFLILLQLSSKRDRVFRQILACFARGLRYASRHSDRSTAERKVLLRIAAQLAWKAGPKATLGALMVR